MMDYISDFSISDSNGVSYEELEMLDVEKVNIDEFIGEINDLEYWEYQGNTGRCAIYSQMFVLEELTGEQFDIEELCDIAEEYGFFSEETGTSMEGAHGLLDLAGIENEATCYNTYEDLEQALANGDKIIVAVDSDEYWEGENDGYHDYGDCANHAVQVVGIDRTDPEHPMVVLNDSGNPDGKGEMVPLDTFLDAWEDSDNYMIRVPANQ